MVRRTIDEGRAALRGIHTTSPAGSSLEQALSILLDEVTPDRGVRLRIFVQGKPRTLRPAIQEQLCLIVREAVVNALRHSNAKTIEVEIQYLRDLLRLFVRDNGRGINPEAVQKESDSHWDLRGMRERADSIGARFRIWNRTSAGTEVRIAAPADGAKGTTQAHSLGRE
jgi:signal transduction histidine kinase